MTINPQSGTLGLSRSRSSDSECLCCKLIHKPLSCAFLLQAPTSADATCVALRVVGMVMVVS